MKALDNLQKLGLSLPEASTPGGSYVSVNVVRGVGYLAIQFPIWNGQYRYQGRLGEALSTEEGYQAAQLCGLNILSQIHHKAGLEQVLSINHFDGYFQSAAGWDESPQVMNGVSDLLLNVLEDAGRHSRAIFGVERLPRNFSVGITASFTLRAGYSLKYP
jgi:enamine deaminase RidA (YjgF/YER057c/UK114 family)